jgi:hypothetical protein
MKNYMKKTQNGLLTTLDESQLEQMFQELFKMSVELSERYNNPQMVASTFMAIGIRMYKTVLSDSEYERMLEFMLDSKDKVKPYDDQGTIH